jgi:hypothetical protein
MFSNIYCHAVHMGYGVIHCFCPLIHKSWAVYSQFKKIQHPFLIEMHTCGAKEILRNTGQKFGGDGVLPRSNANGSLCGFYGKTSHKNGAGMGFSFFDFMETPVNGDHKDAPPVQKTASKGLTWGRLP